MAADSYVEVMLGSIYHEELLPCSICRVPGKLRDLNEDAYKPKSIPIGLLHRGGTIDHQVQAMVELKWHYMHQFLRQDHQEVQGTLESRLTECSQDILRLEEFIRASYDGSILVSELTKEVITRKMIVDGCFLLQLLTRLGNAEGMDPSDPIFESMEKLYSAVNDITLLENQIPFIVLKKLYRKVFGDAFVLEDHHRVATNIVQIEVDHRVTNILQVDNDHQVANIVLESLKELYRKVFGGRVANIVQIEDNHQAANIVPVEDDHRVANIVQRAFGYPLENASVSAHILDFMHLSTVGRSQHRDGKPARQELVRCATKLQAAGIIISPKINQRQLQHRQPLVLADTFDFDISFNDFGELEIPVLYVKETTEVRWMNLIAYEQSRINIRCMYTSYALFFKGLICCEHDIKLLQKKGVIVLNGCDKSKEDLLSLLSTISKGAEHMDSSFSEICKRLNVYKGNKCTIVLQLPLIVWHECRSFFEAVRNYMREGWTILYRAHISKPWKIVGMMTAHVLGWTVFILANRIIYGYLNL